MQVEDGNEEANPKAMELSLRPDSVPFPTTQLERLRTACKAVLLSVLVAMQGASGWRVNVTDQHTVAT